MKFFSREISTVTVVFAIIIVVILAVYLLGFLVFDKMLTVTNYEIHTDKQGSGKIRIVQLSDLHNQCFGKEQKNLIKKVEELEPDLILFTGDIVEYSNYMKNLKYITDAFAGKYPMYYTSGNHEFYRTEEEREKIFANVQKFGITQVENAFIEQTFGENTINIIGVADNMLTTDMLHNLSLEKNDDYFSVVLAHRPQYVNDYLAENVELTMTGHAHGGQVRLPFIGPLYAPNQGLFPKYTSGIYTDETGERNVIISRGLANNAVVCPRILNAPEIVCVDVYFDK